MLSVVRASQIQIWAPAARALRHAPYSSWLLPPLSGATTALLERSLRRGGVLPTSLAFLTVTSPSRRWMAISLRIRLGFRCVASAGGVEKSIHPPPAYLRLQVDSAPFTPLRIVRSGLKQVGNASFASAESTALRSAGTRSAASTAVVLDIARVTAAARRASFSRSAWRAVGFARPAIASSLVVTASLRKVRLRPASRAATSNRRLSLRLRRPENAGNQDDAARRPGHAPGGRHHLHPHLVRH